MKPPRTKPGLLFRLIVPATVVFVLTIMSLIATLFGDERAPVSIWLDKWGNTLLIVEFTVIIVLTLLAMTVDRRRMLRGENEEPIEQETRTEPDSQ